MDDEFYLPDFRASTLEAEEGAQARFISIVVIGYAYLVAFIPGNIRYLLFHNIKYLSMILNR